MIESEFSPIFCNFWMNLIG